MAGKNWNKYFVVSKGEKANETSGKKNERPFWEKGRDF